MAQDGEAKVIRPIQGLLIDLDGTVYAGRALIPGASAAIARLREAGVPYLFTTNTSRMSRSDITTRLAHMGLPVEGSEIFSAPVAAALWLEAEGVRRIHLLASDSTREEFIGFELTQDHPDAMLVGDLGDGFTFQRLNAAFRSLRAGARLVAIHRNRYWLTEEGPTLDAGPFVAALEYASRQKATLVGKPSAAFFGTAAALLKMDRGRLAVVGDDLETDVHGGRAAGLATIQVRTGKYDETLLASASADQRPDHIVDTLADVPALLA